MKTLILLRHGKSDWGSGPGTDHERPLAPRGIEAARRIGRFLADAGLVPDRVVSSTAVRARTTAELAIAAGGFTAPKIETRGLYATNIEGALEVVRAQPDEDDDGRAVDRLLLVGHEPTWSDLASYLVGGGRIGVVTATIAVIDLGITGWSAIRSDRGELRLLLPPRALDGSWK